MSASDTILDGLVEAWTFSSYLNGDFTAIGGLWLLSYEFHSGYGNIPITAGQSLVSGVAASIRGNYPAGRHLRQRLDSDDSLSFLNSGDRVGSGETPFSLQALFRPIWAFPGESGTMIALGADWQLKVDDTTHALMLRLENTTRIVLSPGQFLSGDWLHLIYTHDAGVHKIFVRNLSTGLSFFSSFVQAYSNGGYLKIGALGNGKSGSSEVTQLGNLDLDSIAFWNRPLIALEKEYLDTQSQKEFPFEPTGAPAPFISGLARSNSIRLVAGVRQNTLTMRSRGNSLRLRRGPVLEESQLPAPGSLNLSMYGENLMGLAMCGA